MPSRRPSPGPLPGEQHAANVGLLARVVERGVQLVDGARAERVPDLRAVERNPDDRHVDAAVIGDVVELVGDRLPRIGVEDIRDHTRVLAGGLINDGGSAAGRRRMRRSVAGRRRLAAADCWRIGGRPTADRRQVAGGSVANRRRRAEAGSDHADRPRKYCVDHGRSFNGVSPDVATGSTSTDASVRYAPSPVSAPVAGGGGIARTTPVIGMYERNAGASRRSFLAAAGGAATVGLAGCLGGDDGGLNELTVAHMPIYPDLQWYVMEGEGYFSEIDAEITGREFHRRPVDRAGDRRRRHRRRHVRDRAGAMIVIDRDIPAQVTAANIREPMGIMAEESFHETFEAEGGDAFATWAEENGGPFRFGTFPQGVPDVLLRYWLQEIGVPESNENVEIIEINGASAVWQAIANDDGSTAPRSWSRCQRSPKRRARPSRCSGRPRRSSPASPRRSP